MIRAVAHDRHELDDHQSGGGADLKLHETHGHVTLLKLQLSSRHKMVAITAISMPRNMLIYIRISIYLRISCSLLAGLSDAAPRSL